MTDVDVVFESGIDDGKFHMLVTRPEPYTSHLVVTVVETGEVLLEQDGGLAFDAIFGPDVSDLAEWQDAAIEAVDNYLRSTNA